MRSRRVLPCIRESNRIDLGNDVDPNWRDTDLEDQSRSRQVLLGQAVEGCAESAKCGEHTRSIPGLRTNPDIDILGRTNMAVSRESVGVDDEILNALGVERG